MGSYGITINSAQHVIRNPHIDHDESASRSIRETLQDLYKRRPRLYVYTNSGSASGTALLLSDSVGRAAAPVFATGFERLIWVEMNGIESQEDAGTVVERILKIQDIDAIVLMRQEGSLPWLATWADALAELPPR